MIDISRFMQDGVGKKNIGYEVSVVSGSGTFTANGRIVCAFAVAHGAATYSGRFWGAGYLAPPVSTTFVNALQYTTYYGVSITYVSKKSVSYSCSYTSTVIIVSEKG